MTNVKFLIVTRILWSQVPVYIAEIAPQDQRGVLGAVFQVVSDSEWRHFVHA